MLYEIKVDNTKKLDSSLLNCSMEIAILNRTFREGIIKETTYAEMKSNILKQYNLSHVGI